METEFLKQELPVSRSVGGFFAWLVLPRKMNSQNDKILMYNNI